MIQVDISNVWSAFSLPEFLNMEQEVSGAHQRLAERAQDLSWYTLPDADWEALQAMANKIRQSGEICVVVAGSGYTKALQGVLAILQGTHRNLKNRPKLFFTGDNLSSAHFQELARLLEGRDYSVLAVSSAKMPVETSLTLRSLRWMTERKYGFNKAKGKLFAVTDAREGALYKMAQQGGWECLVSDGGSEDEAGVLTPLGLVPLLVAGVNAAEMLNAAREAGESFALRSFENPVWQYAAVRTLLYRKGRTAELLETAEVSFQPLGQWWQQLFSSAGGALPLSVQFPSGLRNLEARIREGDCFETQLRFEAPENPVRVVSDLQDADGWNCLADMTLEEVAARTMEARLQAQTDSGISVIGIECGGLKAAAVGELLFFMEMTKEICAELSGVNQEKTGTFGDFE